MGGHRRVGAGADEGEIAASGHKVETAIEHLRSRLAAIGHRGHRLAGRLHRGFGAFDDSTGFGARRGRVEPAGRGHVGRPDEQDIHAFDPRNLRDVGDALLRLDLQDGANFVVDPVPVFGAGMTEAGGANCRDSAAPVACRRIFAGADSRFGLCRGFDIGHHDALGARIQRPFDIGRIVPRHAKDDGRSAGLASVVVGGADTAGAQRLHLRGRSHQITGPVLMVDDDEIDTGLSDDLGGHAAVGGQPEAEAFLPGSEPDLHRIAADHEPSSELRREMKRPVNAARARKGSPPATPAGRYMPQSDLALANAARKPFSE